MTHRVEVDVDSQFEEIVDRILASDYRKYIYAAAPFVVALLTTLGFEETPATLWVSAVVSVLVAGLAIANSTTSWRIALYSVVIVVQPLLVWYGIADNRVVTFVSFLLTALGFGVAAATTPSGIPAGTLLPRLEVPELPTIKVPEIVIGRLNDLSPGAGDAASRVLDSVADDIELARERAIERIADRASRFRYGG